MEDYVTLEIAKKLKEKGFDWKTECRFVEQSGPKREEFDEEKQQYVTITPINIYPQPTISQVLKWLREEKAIHISCNIWKFGWYFSVTEYEYYEEDKEYDVKDVYSGYNYSTYEEAILVGIEYVLDVVI